MPSCLIGLGCNQGDRQRLLETAVARLAAASEVRVLALGSWHETAPVGGPPGQSLFLNGAVTIETSLSPQRLLGVLQQIESDLGRRRGARWGPRPIDLDLLLYDEVVLDTPSLQLPHPRMAWRRFVLESAVEVAGAMVHPVTGWTVTRLLEHISATPRYVAITGPIAAGKTHLARRLTEAISGRWLAESPDWSRLAAFYADPASHGWQIELEFLDQRARLLAAVSQPAAGASPAGADRWIVSDFWFEQSRAFAKAWLSPEQFWEFAARGEENRRRVATPRLVVFLDAPVATLLSQLHARDRACERRLNEGHLERIRQAILDEVGRPDVGPVLRWCGGDHDALFTETLAAVQAAE
jgi:2-amino-4-hydroxy-6-hydroxymethyldihydropteridine diphosphokinase